MTLTGDGFAARHGVLAAGYGSRPDPEDPAQVLAMPMVLHLPKVDPPARSDLLAAAASATVALVRALRGNEVFSRIVELDPELLLPYLISRRGRSQQAIVELLADAITAGQRAGTMRAGDPQAIARALVLAGHGFVLSAHTMVDEAATAADLEAELRLLVARAVAP